MHDVATKAVLDSDPNGPKVEVARQAASGHAQIDWSESLTRS